MKIAIGLYDGFTALDAIGPYQVFTNVPGVEVVLCAERAGPLLDDNRLLRFDIDHSFDDVTAPDLLLVPGGIITRRLAAERAPVVGWIEREHPNTTWTTSVCTGALLLGAAGVLEGQVATTHWCSYDALAGYGATPTEQRVGRVRLVAVLVVVDVELLRRRQAVDQAAGLLHAVDRLHEPRVVREVRVIDVRVAAVGRERRAVRVVGAAVERDRLEALARLALAVLAQLAVDAADKGRQQAHQSGQHVASRLARPNQRCQPL